MKSAIITSAAVLLLTTGVALANGNSDAAKGMVDAIEANGADIAPTVSGKDARENSGWGNGGSAAFGDQVSKSGKPG